MKSCSSKMIDQKQGRRVVVRNSERIEPLGSVVSKILDPVFQKHGVILVALIKSWPEIMGPFLSDLSRPEKVTWKYQHDVKNSETRPATLVLSCEGIALLHIQHQLYEIIHRVNVFLGYLAIERIRLIQKPVRLDRKTSLEVMKQSSHENIFSLPLSGIENENFRISLQNLGKLIKMSNL